MDKAIEILEQLAHPGTRPIIQRTEAMVALDELRDTMDELKSFLLETSEFFKLLKEKIASCD